MDEFLVFEIGYSSNEIWNELSRGRKVLKIGQFSATQGERLGVTNGQRAQFCFSLQKDFFYFNVNNKNKDTNTKMQDNLPSKSCFEKWLWIIEWFCDTDDNSWHIEELKSWYLWKWDDT